MTVNANGDDLDPNGLLITNGSTTTIYGPASSTNNALGSNGTMSITSDTIIAFVTNGIAETPTATDGQGWISAAAPGPVGATVAITDSPGSVLDTCTSPKAFGDTVYSISDMTNGSTYTVSIDGTSAETTTGQDGGIGGPMDPGDPGQGGQPLAGDQPPVGGPGQGG